MPRPKKKKPAASEQAAKPEPAWVDPSRPKKPGDPGWEPNNRGVRGVHTRFKPGISGNPNGLPKGFVSPTLKLRIKMGEVARDRDGKPVLDADGKPRTWADLVADRMLKDALGGNPATQRLLFERVDGNRVNLSIDDKRADDGSAITRAIDGDEGTLDQLLAVANRLIDRESKR